MTKNNYRLLIYFIIVFLSTIVFASLYFKFNNKQNLLNNQNSDTVLGVDTKVEKNIQQEGSSYKENNTTTNEAVHEIMSEMKNSIKIIDEFEDELDSRINNIDEIASLD
jgi:cell division protein YceG involved in septum cleavage